MAMRSAIGASRARIIGQLFVEALVLASIAATVGLIAVDRTLRWGVKSVAEGNGGLPFWMTPGLDITTILYAGGLAVAGAAMLAISGVMALTLGVIGIYGVIAYIVAQRSREIGIRLALGAAPTTLKRMFVRQGLVLTSVGAGVGLVTAIALSQWMSSLLFGVERLDPPTYVAVLGVLATAAAMASYVPARRAAAVDPVEALTAE